MPLRQQRRVRWLSTWILAVTYVGLGVAYLFPDEFVRNPNPLLRSNQNSVIVFIENLTAVPVWGALFLIAGVWLGAALIDGRRNADRHTAGALLVGSVVCVMYSFAGWSTAIINPGTYVSGAILSTGFAALSFSLMYSFAQRPTLISLRELEKIEEAQEGKPKDAT